MFCTVNLTVSCLDDPDFILDCDDDVFVVVVDVAMAVARHGVEYVADWYSLIG